VQKLEVSGADAIEAEPCAWFWALLARAERCFVPLESAVLAAAQCWAPAGILMDVVVAALPTVPLASPLLWCVGQMWRACMGISNWTL
jgi:hypothetical protein